VDLVEEKKTRGVFLQLLGTVQTHWTETEYYTDSRNERKSRTVTHSETVEIVNFRSCLWQPAPGQDSGIIPPGTYSMPFSFVLPPTISYPPTFFGESGQITYVLKANIDRPWKFDHKTYRPVTVLPFVDANHPSFAQELRRDDEKTICCCCCAQGPITASVRVPSAAWCPGEVIPLLVRVENHSKSQLQGVSCALDRRTRFYAHGHSTTADKRVESTRWPQSIAPQSTFEAQVLLRVPPCCPTIRLEASRIIELMYTLDTVIHLPSGSFNMHLRVPVEVATIPHARPPMFGQQQQAPPVYTWATPEGIAQAAAQAMAGQAMAPPPAYDDTFAEREPDFGHFQGAVQYVAFQMPEPSAPPQPSMAMAAQKLAETTPLIAAAATQAATASTTGGSATFQSQSGGTTVEVTVSGNMSSDAAAAAAAAAATGVAATTTMAAAMAMPMMFAAPCALGAVPKD